MKKTCRRRGGWRIAVCVCDSSTGSALVQSMVSPSSPWERDSCHGSGAPNFIGHSQFRLVASVDLLSTKGRHQKSIPIGLQVPSEKVFGVGARRVQTPCEEVRLEPYSPYRNPSRTLPSVETDDPRSLTDTRNLVPNAPAAVATEWLLGFPKSLSTKDMGHQDSALPLRSGPRQGGRGRPGRGGEKRKKPLRRKKMQEPTWQ